MAGLGNKLYTTTDAGSTFSTYDSGSAVYNNRFCAAAYGGGVWLAFTLLNKKCFRSTDGVSWTDEGAIAFPSSYTATRGAYYVGGTFYVFENGYANVASSTDGQTWAVSSTGLPATPSVVAWDGIQWLAMNGDDIRIAESPTGPWALFSNNLPSEINPSFAWWYPTTGGALFLSNYANPDYGYQSVHFGQVGPFPETFWDADYHQSDAYTLDEGTRRATRTAVEDGTYKRARASKSASSGKVYWEYQNVADQGQAGFVILFGTSKEGDSQDTNMAFSLGLSFAGGSNGSTVMLAWDIDSGQYWIGADGVWEGSGNPATNSNWSGSAVGGGDNYHPTFTCAHTGVACTFALSAADQTYSAPSGFTPIGDL